jgi:hypothetical protein
MQIYLLRKRKIYNIYIYIYIYINLIRNDILKTKITNNTFKGRSNTKKKIQNENNPFAFFDYVLLQCKNVAIHA